MNERMEKAINGQINAEIYSAYLYMAMAAYFESINLQGFSNWMRIQVQEELAHAEKFYSYVFERGGRVILGQIDAPPVEWSSSLNTFEEVYKHECHVSNLINELVNLAIEEKDHATNNMLQWFVSEQVEEEASADGIIQRLKLAGEEGAGLFMVDQELGGRTFTPPAAV